MEQRLIDADTLMETIKAHDYPLRDYFNSTDSGMFTFGIQQAVDEQPTVDAVPVVRCSECKHNIGEKVWLDGDVTIDCANGMGYPPPNWFCADGERRSDGK